MVSPTTSTGTRGAAPRTATGSRSGRSAKWCGCALASPKATTSRRKLSSTLADFVPDEEERRWVEPRLLHLLGLSDRPPGERGEIFSAWRTFFERIAARGPTLMIFEDLQWADAGLLDFIESMLEWSKNHPILMITLARPELADKRPNWGAEQRSFSSIRLEPLPDDAIAELVEGFVHGLPPDGVERIVARADGVPLYAVETVRMLADRGALELGEEAYELVGDVGALEIPETLQALIAARLDAQPPEDRALLQDASVLGKSFTLEALGAVADADPTALEPRLRALARKEFLEFEADPRSPERGQYAFVQSLIREVAYGTLSKADRRRRHLAVAHHLESLDDEELAGVVAAHYVEAFRATPEGPDAEALAARARDWLAQAAERAASLGSPEQALGYVEQALEITPSGVERADLLEKAAHAARDSALPERCVAYLDEAIALTLEAGDTSRAATLTAQIARPMLGLGRGSEALEPMRKALVDLGPDIDEAARANLILQIAGLNLTLGFPGESLVQVEETLPILERRQLDELLEEAITTKAWALYNLGRHREAAILGRGALTLAEEIGSQRDRADALLMMGVLLGEEDPRGSLRASLDGAEAARRAGSRPIELTCLTNGVEAAVELGEWVEADRLLADLEVRPDLTPHAASAIDVNAAVLAAYRGDQEQATTRLEKAAAHMETSDFLQSRTWLLRVRCTAALMRGDPEAAYAFGMKAIEEDPAGINTPFASWGVARAALWLRDAEKARTARETMAPLRGRWIQAAKWTVDAGIAALGGRVDEATELYRRSLDAWKALDSPIDYAYSTIDAATLLPADALPQDDVHRARSLLEGLGADGLLERLSLAEQPATTGTG